MLVVRVIVYLDILVWLFPPFRQHRKRYFYYFLLLGISDPLFQLLYNFVKFHPFRLYEIFTPLMLISVLNFKWNYKYIITSAILIIISIFITAFAPIPFISINLLILHLVILSFFLTATTLELHNNRTINIFYFVLCLYQLSLAMKYLIFLIDLRTGVFYFYITTAFEILIAAFFIFFNEKNSPKLRIDF